MPRKTALNRPAETQAIAESSDHIFDLCRFESLRIYIHDEKGRLLCIFHFDRKELRNAGINDRQVLAFKFTSMRYGPRIPESELPSMLAELDFDAPAKRKLHDQTAHLYFNPNDKEKPGLVIHGRPGSPAVRVSALGQGKLEELGITVYSGDDTPLYTVTVLGRREEDTVDIVDKLLGELEETDAQREPKEKGGAKNAKKK